MACSLQITNKDTGMLHSISWSLIKIDEAFSNKIITRRQQPKSQVLHCKGSPYLS